MVGFGQGGGPLWHLGAGLDRKGECVVRGVLGIHASPGEGNLSVGPAGWFGGDASLTNERVHHAVPGVHTTLSLEGWGFP